MDANHPALGPALAADAIRCELEKLVAWRVRVRTSAEPEEVHQMRVALRRVRTAERLLVRWLPGRSKAAGVEVTWVSGVLAGLRDLDVLKAQVERWRRKAPAEEEPGFEQVLAAIEQRRAAGLDATREALDSDRYRELMAALHDLVADVPSVGTIGEVEALECQSTLRHYLKRVRRQGSSILGRSGRCRARRLHRLRISNKRLRDALDLCAPLLGSGLPPFLDVTLSLHTALGKHQDAHVGLVYLRDLRATQVALFSADTVVLSELERRYRRRARGAGKQALAAYRRFKRQPWRALVGKRGAGGHGHLPFLSKPSKARSTL